MVTEPLPINLPMVVSCCTLEALLARPQQLSRVEYISPCADPHLRSRLWFSISSSPPLSLSLSPPSCVPHNRPPILSRFCSAYLATYVPLSALSMIYYRQTKIVPVPNCTWYTAESEKH